jgi:hypothetical protein
MRLPLERPEHRADGLDPVAAVGHSMAFGGVVGAGPAILATIDAHLPGGTADSTTHRRTPESTTHSPNSA